MRDGREPCHSERWWVSDQISNLFSYKSKNSKKHVLFSCYITIYYEYYKLENPNMSWLNFRWSFLSKVDIFQSIIPTGYRGPKLRKFGPIGGFEDVFFEFWTLVCFLSGATSFSFAHKSTAYFSKKETWSFKYFTQKYVMVAETCLFLVITFCKKKAWWNIVISKSYLVLTVWEKLGPKGTACFLQKNLPFGFFFGSQNNDRRPQNVTQIMWEVWHLFEKTIEPYNEITMLL